MTTHLNKMNKSVSEVVFRKHFYSRFRIGLWKFTISWDVRSFLIISLIGSDIAERVFS
jgi:hypothetical protein